MVDTITENWFGMDCHPTDSYIHWSNQDPKGTAKSLREAYNRFNPEQLDALKLLLSAAYRTGGDDENEQHAGAEL